MVITWEHNFGHGQQDLALVLVMLNVGAFLFHTVLDLCDTLYRQVRAELVARQTFFNDLQALMRPTFPSGHQPIQLVTSVLTRSPHPPPHDRQPAGSQRLSPVKRGTHMVAFGIPACGSAT